MTNPLLVEAYQAWGATPTPLPWGEVYGALQTGIIQGQENPSFFLESTKMYEVTDVITYLGHNNFTTAVMANKDFFDGLSDEDKEVDPQRQRRGVRAISSSTSRTCSEESLAKIKEAKPDMTVNVLSEEQREPFMAAAGEVEAAFIEMTGESGQAILDQMKADLAAVR